MKRARFFPIAKLKKNNELVKQVFLLIVKIYTPPNPFAASLGEGRGRLGKNVIKRIYQK